MSFVGNQQTRKQISRLWQHQGAGALIILAVLFAVLSVASPYFLTWENLSNLLLQSVFVMVAAFGMTFVLAMGGIDLSVGSVLGLCGGVTGVLMMHGINTWLAILCGLSVGAAVGALNGLIITWLRVADFLATFATLNIVRGILLVSTILHPIRRFSTPQFAFLTQGQVLGVPTAVLIAAAVFGGCYFLLTWTSFGRRVLAVGNNREAARLSGVRVQGVRLTAYMLSGILAAVSGIMLASRVAAVQPLMGESYELDVIAAAVIGGASMSGGRGGVLGTLLGSLILAVVANGLDMMSVDQFYRKIITGLVIVAAVGADRQAVLRSRWR